MRIHSTAVLLLIPFFSFGQYAPKAGMAGSTAIHKDSSVFVDWASTCSVNRGYQSVQYPDSGKVNVGLDQYGKDKADGFIVSLGDGGTAVLSFKTPLVDGPGYDFAVFENGFTIPTGNDSDFLELAFVEVSSDGINFHRFPAFCSLDSTRQQETFDGAKASNYRNLAGKYTAGFGTPFDLSELDTVSGLDLQNITHVKLIDVVGSVNDSFATRGFDGVKINDPWPTLFPQGGFDLDAVGVIHNQQFPNAINRIAENSLLIYPNPVQDLVSVKIKGLLEFEQWSLFTVSGELVLSGSESKIDTKALKPGLYFFISENHKPLKLMVR